jgi:membrane protease YdiL (CAAX protease family)
MRLLVEAFILYTLFFFPRYVETPMFIPFSVYRELFRIFTFNIPAFFLIFYLLNGKNFYKKLGNKVSLRWGLRFLLVFFVVLVGLCIVSFCMSTAARFFSFDLGLVLEKPHGVVGWVVLLVSCLTTGLLEESFFRVYLPKCFSGGGVVSGGAFLFSTMFFTFSHLYEGLWGMVNAFVAGVFLCIVFAKSKSLVGVAAAHGVYNVLVYALSAGVF